MAILAAQKKARRRTSGIVDDRAGAVERVTAIGFLTPFPCSAGSRRRAWPTSGVPECGILHTLDYRDEPPPQAVPWYHKDYVAPDKKANAFVTAHVHTTVNWSELRRSRRLSQVDLGGRSSLANVAGASDRDSWDLAVFQAHDDVEVTSLQIIEKPRTILTASEDGLARIWTWNGVLVGQLDVNRPAGGDGPRKVPWDFVVQSTSAKTEVRGVQETLSAAKVAAAAFASVPRSARGGATRRSRMTQIQRSRTSTPPTPKSPPAASPGRKKRPLKKEPDPKPKLSLATNRGLALSQSAPNLSRATTPASEHSSRPTTALSPEEGWDAVRARTSTFHGRVRSDKKPEDHSWDAIFDGIASLEKNAELKRSQSLPRAASSQNRRPQTGKWWQTRDSMAPIIAFAPELSELSSSFSTVDPPHKRDKRAQTAAARLRAKPRPLAEVIATKRRPIPGSTRGRGADGGLRGQRPQPLARLTRLAHMGL
ncbi:hypothetical protein JL720_12966 [Aureococcus anophagefferens]|nr:hypothetical protein JL720_12966 [Aureococcus anophagefferens]